MCVHNLTSADCLSPSLPPFLSREVVRIETFHESVGPIDEEKEIVLDILYFFRPTSCERLPPPKKNPTTSSQNILLVGDAPLSNFFFFFFSSWNVEISYHELSSRKVLIR